jgi:hypothetical protein
MGFGPTDSLSVKAFGAVLFRGRGAAAGMAHAKDAKGGNAEVGEESLRGEGGESRGAAAGDVPARPGASCCHTTLPTQIIKALALSRSFFVR